MRPTASTTCTLTLIGTSVIVPACAAGVDQPFGLSFELDAPLWTKSISSNLIARCICRALTIMARQPRCGELLTVGSPCPACSATLLISPCESCSRRTIRSGTRCFSTCRTAISRASSSISTSRGRVFGLGVTQEHVDGLEHFRLLHQRHRPHRRGVDRNDQHSLGTGGVASPAAFTLMGLSFRNKSR